MHHPALHLLFCTSLCVVSLNVYCLCKGELLFRDVTGVSPFGGPLLCLPRTQPGCPHSEHVVFVWLCIIPHWRVSSGVVCGVVAGLSVGCVSGSHLIYVIRGVQKRLCSEILWQCVLCHSVFVHYSAYAVCVATHVGVYRVPAMVGVVQVWLTSQRRCCIWASGSMYPVPPPTPWGTILGHVLCDAPKYIRLSYFVPFGFLYVSLCIVGVYTCPFTLL